MAFCFRLPVMDNLKYDGIRFRAFLKCNRHFDEFIFREKMARKMEDFPCFRLAFWRGGDRRGNLSPSALAKNKCNAVFRLVLATGRS